MTECHHCLMLVCLSAHLRYPPKVVRYPGTVAYFDIWYGWIGDAGRSPVIRYYSVIPIENISDLRLGTRRRQLDGNAPFSVLFYLLTFVYSPQGGLDMKKTFHRLTKWIRPFFEHNSDLLVRCKFPALCASLDVVRTSCHTVLHTRTTMQAAFRLHLLHWMPTKMTSWRGTWVSASCTASRRGKARGIFSNWRQLNVSKHGRPIVFSLLPPSKFQRREGKNSWHANLPPASRPTRAP